MFGAFLYLVGCTLRNRLFQRLRRLRHPRYLIGLALGLGYVWLVFLRPFPRPFVGTRTSSPTGFSDVPLILASLGLAALAARWWLFGAGTAALAFAPAEAQFLFPAPLRRRDLLTYKLVAVQVPLLTSTVLFGVFTTRWGRTIPVPLRMVALWLLLLTLFMHQLGASLVRVGVMRARPGAKRPLVALALFSAAAAILLGSIVLAIPALSNAPDIGSAITVLAGAVRGPVTAAVLWPFRATLAPAFAVTAAAWGQALVGAVAILIAHYLWLVRLDVPFEDAAADASVALAEGLRVLRQRVAGSPVNGAIKPGTSARRGAAWFALRPVGQPAVAILWKNLVNLQRRGWRGVLPVVVLVTVMLVVTATQRARAEAITGALAIVATTFAVMLALFGSAAFRLDLRQDVAYLALLRTYPLSGFRIVIAEVASSVLPLTSLQLALIGFASAIYPDASISTSTRLLALAVAVLVLPVLNATTATIGNATALLFPATRTAGAGVGGTGVELMGQLFLARIAGLLALMVTLILPMTAGAAVVWGTTRVSAAPSASVAGVLTASAVLAAQLYIMLRWLGRVFERTDTVAVSAVD